MKGRLLTGPSLRGGGFVAAVLGLTAIGVYTISGMLDLARSHPVAASLWVVGFAVLFFNVAYMLVAAVVSSWPGRSPLARLRLGDRLPRSAIVYVARNENPSVLLANLAKSFAGNCTPGIDLWLLSNSEIASFARADRRVVEQLRERWGSSRVGLFVSPRNSLRRKHVALQQWVEEHPNYEYLVVCDADTVLPAGSVRHLLEIAEHPENKRIGLLQSRIDALPGATRFTRWLGVGQEIGQRIYATAHQRAFGRGVSFGSGCLVRRSALAEIDVPEWVLSHDMWDTAHLERAGHRVTFVPEIVTLGAFPGNYVEFLRRNRRWVLGTLESLGVVRLSRVPLATRLMLLLPSYLYLSQPLFLLWIIAGLFVASAGGGLLSTQRYAFLGATYVDIEMGGQLILTLAIVVGHRFVQCRSPGDLLKVAGEVTSSVLLCLNGIVYSSLAVLEFFAAGRRGREWVPMAKGAEGLTLGRTVAVLWPSTVLGALLAIVGFSYAPDWAWVALPFLASFLLGIPLTFFTARAPSRSSSAPYRAKARARRTACSESPVRS